MSAILTIENLRVEYSVGSQKVLAVNNVSFHVKEGEFFTLLGPSGCGKTTILRSVAGLETPTAGVIKIDGKTVFSGADGLVVPAQARDIAMVFQSYAIWPHMTVYHNVAYPLDAKGIRGAEARERVKEALRMVGLSEYMDRPAPQLSGGQQQRVAVARALVKESKLLLLDEPLSNLDAKLREQMRREMRELQQRVGTTTMYVTHDQEEALALSDRIAVMNAGRIVEVGTHMDLYLRPRHPFTARFIGQAELLSCTVLGRDERGVRVRTELGELVAGVHQDLADRATHVLIRPECVAIVDEGDPDPARDNVLEGAITNLVFSGKIVEYEVDLVTGGSLKVQASPIALRHVGDRVRLRLPIDRCVLLADTDGVGASAEADARLSA